MKSIKTLESLGFNITLDVKIVNDGGVSPDKNIVDECIERIREHKQEAISYLRRRMSDSTEIKKLDAIDSLLIDTAAKLLKSEALRREINLYIKAGNISKDTLVDMLLKLASLITGDDLFYTLNTNRLEKGGVYK